VKTPTRWVRLSVEWHLNPKLMALSDGAKVLYLASIAESGRLRSDGLVDAFALRSVCTRSALRMRELVDAGLWAPAPGRNTLYRVHDFTDWNETADQLAEIASAKRKAAHARWNGTDAASNARADADAVQTHQEAEMHVQSKRNATETETKTKTPTVGAPKPAPVDNSRHGGSKDQAEQILPSRLRRILQDDVVRQLTPGQMRQVAKAWDANDVEMRHGMAGVETAANPVAYLVSMARRIGGAA
jgi:hypothetical protein